MVTIETFNCGECGKATSFEAFRTPEYHPFEKTQRLEVFPHGIFFPQVISGIALAALWRSIYNADTGLLDGLLRAMGMGELACDWLGGLETAFPAVLIYWVFYVGYYIIL